MSPFPYRQYRLNTDTIAVLASGDGKSTSLQIPAESTITVLEGLTDSDMPNRQVRVQWIGKTLRMFAVDVLERGERV
jgi:hypothetical protein